MTFLSARPSSLRRELESERGAKWRVSIPGAIFTIAACARCDNARAILLRVNSPRKVRWSTPSPIRRIAHENGHTRDHQTSCPCVNATIFSTPALRKPCDSKASGAAAPKKTVVIERSFTRARTLKPTRKVGSRIWLRSRITSTPYSLIHRASKGRESSCEDVKTMTEFFGIRSMSPITKVSIPPARGPKSLVMQRIFCGAEMCALIRTGGRLPKVFVRVMPRQL